MNEASSPGGLLAVTRDRRLSTSLRGCAPLADLEFRGTIEPAAFKPEDPRLEEAALIVFGLSELRSLRRRRLLPVLEMPRRLVVAVGPDQLAALPDFLETAGLLPALAGCLLVGRTEEEMAAVLRLATAGYLALPPSLLLSVLDRDAQTERLAALSPEERKLLLQLREGLSNREIASRAKVSERQVKGAVRALLDKLGCRGRTAAAVLASRLDTETYAPDGESTE